MDILATVIGAGGAGAGALFASEGGGESGLVINWFWILVSAANFLFFLFVLYRLALGPLNKLLDERRERIEQGLADAEQARQDRERAEQERAAALAEARREANEIVARAQRMAQESRDRDIAATKEELERLRQRAADEIQAEKQRAVEDLRAEVADLALAAAGKVVGESMTDDRQRRLVQDFLRETEPGNGRERGG